MADDELQSAPANTEAAPDAPAEAAARTAKKAAVKKTAAKKATTKKTTTKKAAAKKAAAPAAEPDPDAPAEAAADETPAAKPAKKAAAKKSAAKKTTAKKASTKKAPPEQPGPPVESPVEPQTDTPAEAEAASGTMPLFQAPEPTTPVKRSRSRARKPAEEPAEPAEPTLDEDDEAAETPAAAEAPEAPEAETATDDDAEGDSGPRRRRRRGGRRRRGKSGDSEASSEGDEPDEAGTDKPEKSEKSDKSDKSDRSEQSDGESGGGTSTRRRRKRRREGEGDGGSDSGDGANTTTRVRRSRSPEDEITALAGSTRLEAKKQRRREGREAGRRRAPIVSEAEFLARRESVERVMVVRQRDELTQIGVLEDKVLVEHYVARESQTSLIGNVYLGRVQNVLPSMEAAFIDIGKGRNAVLYAGEVNWSQLGHKDGSPRKIESVLSSGQTILVQVSKDPVGHKGARLTSQISLAGRFLVYVPDGTTSGISRKLPDTERNRLKTLLKEIVPDTAGVIVRTAAEGASEAELTQDVERLKARWEEIEGKSGGKGGKSGNPQLLYGEPDLTLKVVRDLFTEDFAKLVIQGDDAWDLVRGYVQGVAPDLEERLEQYATDEHNGVDLFAAYRVDEQIAKALDRKVWLPSGGSLVIDRTEAMTVVDVNTGKFTGSGGNLEETVTKNNLEAAEEVVRQLRLRDIGGIIVVDFIDMVLESNRDLVLRRLVECLGRDRTRHQVAEVTSLGLVQMTRKRIGTGLLEAFSENCEHCQGRGVVVHDMPVEPKRGPSDDEQKRGGGRRRGGRGRGDDSQGASSGTQSDAAIAAAHKPTPAEFAAMAKAEVHKDAAAEAEPDETPVETPVETPDETPDEKPAPEVEPVEALESAEATAPVEPVEPAAPKVVTRTRRGVSRTVATAAPVTPVEAAPAPVEAPAPESTALVVPATAPEPPKVVTRTRGRAASRVAGPPPAPAEEPTDQPTDQPTDRPAWDVVPSVGAVGAPVESGAVEPNVGDVEPGDASGTGETGEAGEDSAEPELHVPIKRKRTRKR